MADALPEWQEFRPQRRGESELNYLRSLFEFSIGQSRARDHWLANQLHVMFGNAELLREELMGEGDILRQPGILRVLKSNQDRFPEMIRETVRESIQETQNAESAAKYSAMKKWWWGVLGGVIVAVVGLVIYLLTGVHT